MEKVVLHINKAKGNDSGTTAHIERTVDPPNADKTRMHLNKELVEFPEGITNRTQAIQHRIENAKIGRKMRHDQVRALQVMLSGSPANMQRIQQEGSLNEWCKDNIEWLHETFGKENLVSAVLHMDEKTPHIHATVVPIVSGERRKAKKTDPNKKKYKTKKDGNRLCADDVMARDKLVGYQDSYAEKMKKYDFERGVKGSDARHITNTEYAKQLLSDLEYAKDDIQHLQQRKEDVKADIWDLYDRKDEAREKYLNMDEHIKKKEKDIIAVESRLQQLKQEYEPYKAQEELNFIHKLFPIMKEQLRIAILCEKIGLAINSIIKLLEGKALTAPTFKFYSPEHKLHFEAKEVRLKIEKENNNPEKLSLNLNGNNIMDWFKEKSKELHQRTGINIKTKGKTRRL